MSICIATMGKFQGPRMTGYPGSAGIGGVAVIPPGLQKPSLLFLNVKDKYNKKPKMNIRMIENENKN